MAFATGAIAVIVVLLFVYLVLLGIGIANYVMQSLSLYTLANNRGIQNAWLAWVPIGCTWIIGSIADFHDAQVGVKRNWRTVATVLYAVGFAGFIVTYIAMFVFGFVMGFSDMMMVDSAQHVAPFVGGFAVVYILMLLAVLVFSAAGICNTICLYKIFEVVAPEKAVKYIVLSMLVPLASAICLMKCRNSQNGIPQPMYPSMPTDGYEGSVDVPPYSGQE